MDIAEVLRERGSRVTTARRLVWNVLSEADHLTAAEIGDRVVERDAGVNRSSIYRALECFSDLDLVRESRTDSTGSSTWEIRHPDGEIHLVCTGCGRVIHHSTDLVESLRLELEQQRHYQAEMIDIHVSGICAECAETGSQTLGG